MHRHQHQQPPASVGAMQSGPLFSMVDLAKCQPTRVGSVIPRCYGKADMWYVSGLSGTVQTCNQTSMMGTMRASCKAKYVCKCSRHAPPPRTTYLSVSPPLWRHAMAVWAMHDVCKHATRTLHAHAQVRAWLDALHPNAMPCNLPPPPSTHPQRELHGGHMLDA